MDKMTKHQLDYDTAYRYDQPEEFTWMSLRKGIAH
jgi:hypothetical protein